MIKQNKKYKIALVGYHLSDGGLEKVMSLLSIFFGSKDVDVHNILFADKVAYPYSGKLLNIGKMKNKNYGFQGKFKLLLYFRRYLIENKFDFNNDFRFRTNLFKELFFSMVAYNSKISYTVYGSHLETYLPSSKWLTNTIFKIKFSVVCNINKIKDLLLRKFDFKNYQRIYSSIDFVENDIEILVATMNRTDLDFLSKMFPFKHFSNYNILIVNQSKKNVLSSDYPSIRVINTDDLGLSKSRNLALLKAVGKILIIADDDIVYQSDFVKKTIAAYNKFKQATVITFCAVKNNGSYLKKYPSDSKKQLNSIGIFNSSSIEITINKEKLDLSKIKFDENFGLGGVFEMGEEAIFLFDLKRKNLQVSFVNQILVKHGDLTTSNKINILRKYYIFGAILTRISKINYVSWLILKIFFDLKQKKLKLSSFFDAIISAKKGRKKIQSLHYGK
jgi:hypothetical protein